MKNILPYFLFVHISFSALSQNPATDSKPLTHNYDNKIIFCGTTDCSGNGTRDWEWDCIMGCAKVGDVFVNMSETDCNGVKKSAYDVMSNGKPLMILWEGWDCGNCHGGAPKVSDFILKNKDKFNFWMAFGGIGGGAACGEASNSRTPASWISKYPAFSNAFAFLDNDVTYIYNYHSLPQYSLIDPKTKKFVYRSSQNEGNDPWGRMVTAADKLISTITAVDVSEKASGLLIFPNPAEGNADFELNLNTTAVVRIFVVNVMGQEVEEVYNGITNKVVKNMDLTKLKSGVYYVNTIVNGQRFKTNKLTIK